jgi:hypothetical protein
VLLEERITIKIHPKCDNIHASKINNEQQTIKVVINHIINGLLETWEILSQVDEKPISISQQAIQPYGFKGVIQPEVDKVIVADARIVNKGSASVFLSEVPDEPGDNFPVNPTKIHEV